MQGGGTCPLPKKWPYLHERYSRCWNEWKTNFPIHIFWVMVGCVYIFRWNTLISNSFKSGYIFMKDPQCAETNEKLILRILVFEIWSILYWNSEIYYVRLAPTPGSGASGLNPRSQLVIGYHWLGFLNQVSINLFKSLVHC